MADSFGDRDQGPGGASRRPAHTIEGTAIEISSGSAGNGTPRAEPESQADKGEDAPETARVDNPPPPKTSLPELKSFVTHLAAGMLGGLVGVIALAFAWGAFTNGGDTAAPAPDIALLEQRIAKLESTQPISGDAEALSQLESRVAALESSTKDASPRLSDLADRIAQLETALKALAQSASEGGSVASAAAIAQQITEAEQRLDAMIADALAKTEAANASAIQQMQSEIAELKAKIGALAELGTGETTGTGPELASLIERIAKLEAVIPELTSAIGKETEGAKSAAIAIAFANLHASVGAGRPYAAELDTIGALAPDVGDLGVLPAYAEKGIPTLPDLGRSFATAASSVLAAVAPSPGGTIADSLMASAQSLVKIKRIDEPATGEGPAAALARAKAALGKDDLAGAVKEVETLDGAAREAFSAWLGQAHARLSADETLTRLEGLLLVSIGEDSQAPRP